MTVFAAALMIFACACTTTSTDGAGSEKPPATIEIVEKGEPAPGDGFWVSRQTFLKIYAAAERTAALESRPDQEDRPRSLAD